MVGILDFMFVLDDHTQLVQACYAAATEGAQGWPAFAALLGRKTQSDGVGIYGDGIHVQWHEAEPLHNDLIAPLRYNRVYGQEDLQPAYAGRAYLRLLKLRGGTGAVWVVLSRDSYRSDYRSVEGQMLDALAPYLTQAFEISAQLAQARADAQRTEQLAHDGGLGWITFDLRGTVLRASGTAVTWAAAQGCDILRVKRLELPDADAAYALTQGMAQCRAGGAQNVRIEAAPSGEILFTKPDHEDTIHARLRITPILARLDIAQIAARLAITPSEARLVQLLGDGTALKDAAAQLGWTEGSARSCSKAIFAKLGLSGQAELMRSVHTGGLWL